MTGVGERVKAAVRRADAWINSTIGLGTDRDKRTSTKLKGVWWLDQQSVEALYHSNDMAAVIVDALPEEAMREPWDLSLGEDSDDAPEVDRAAAELSVREAVLEAWSLGRLYGGSALILGADDGQDMAEPLAIDRVRELRYLHPVGRYSLNVDMWDDDPRSATFGLPLLFRVFPPSAGGVQSAGSVVHRSRMVFFGGQRTPPELRAQQQGWDASVLQRPYEVLQDFGVSWGGVANLMADLSQAVFKIEGLHDLIASNDMETVQKRQMMADKDRSVMKGIWLDAQNEGFERVATPMEGVHQTLQLFIQRLAGAARMPATILMGQSPAGMNATGESDIRWWYNRVESAQQNELAPRLQYIYRVLMASLDVDPPDEWGVTFRPLWKASESEQAEVQLKRAQRDKVYADLGVAQPEEIALSRFRNAPEWDRVDLEAREQILEGREPGERAETGEPDEETEQQDVADALERSDELRNDALERSRKVQTLILSKSRFQTRAQVKRWVRDHNYVIHKIDETEDTFRVRQRNPGRFDQDSFRTIDFDDDGTVKAVTGFLKR